MRTIRSTLFPVRVQINVWVPALLLVTTAFGTEGAPRAVDLEDPVFGIKLGANAARFPLASADVLRQCAASLEKAQYRIFGQYAADGIRYIILGGTAEVAPDGGVEAPQPFSQGVVVRLSDGACQSGDPGTVLLGRSVHGRAPHDPQQVIDWQISASDLMGLTKDVIREYATAFGDAKSFQTALKNGHYHITTEAPPVLAQQLSAIGIGGF
jgi:hypothetical protein